VTRDPASDESCTVSDVPATSSVAPSTPRFFASSNLSIMRVSQYSALRSLPMYRFLSESTV